MTFDAESGAVETLVFVDVDGVLNVSVEDPKSGVISFDRKNLDRAHMLAEKAASSHEGAPVPPVAERLISTSQRALEGEDGTTYAEFVTDPATGLSELLVARLAEILLAAGGRRTVVLSSAWRTPQHVARVQALEQAVSGHMGQAFEFDARTDMKREMAKGDRLRLIGDFVAGYCAEPRPGPLRVLVLDAFCCCGAIRGWECGGVPVNSARDAETYLEGRAPAPLSASAKIIHTYDEWKTPSDLLVRIGAGLTKKLLAQANLFLADGACEVERMTSPDFDDAPEFGRLTTTRPEDTADAGEFNYAPKVLHDEDSAAGSAAGSSPRDGQAAPAAMDCDPAAMDCDGIAEPIDTLVFVDVDGVLNVSVLDPRSGVMAFDSNNIARAFKLQQQGTLSKVSVAERLVSCHAREIQGEAGVTYAEFVSDQETGLSDVLAARLAEITRSAGKRRTMVLSSTWRTAQHVPRVRMLEQMVSRHLGEPFTFDARTAIEREAAKEDRLRLIGDYVVKHCGQYAADQHPSAKAQLRVVVLDDFCCGPISAWHYQGFVVNSAADAEKYLTDRAPVCVETSAKVVHTYDSWTTPGGLPVHIGAGITRKHLAEANAFLEGRRDPEA